MKRTSIRQLATIAAAGAMAARTRVALAASPAEAASPPAAAGDSPMLAPSVTVLDPLLYGVMLFGVALLTLGMLLCVWRMMRGPHLADRVLAGDTLAFHVVGLVIVLGMWLQTTVFFDAALVVAIIGFASTVAFAQYIGADPTTPTSPTRRSGNSLSASPEPRR